MIWSLHIVVVKEKTCAHMHIFIYLLILASYYYGLKLLMFLNWNTDRGIGEWIRGVENEVCQTFFSLGKPENANAYRTTIITSGGDGIHEMVRYFDHVWLSSKVASLEYVVFMASLRSCRHAYLVNCKFYDYIIWSSRFSSPSRHPCARTNEV